MARRTRASRLETRTARLKLAIREKPYDFTPISPGIGLGYRRNHAAGTWVVRVADGKGGNWTKRVGLADDFEDADAEHVLTFWQAQDKARKLARGTDDAGRPATVGEAIDAYERDLIARDGSVANAGRIRKHLTPTLASKPVGLLRAVELAAWRDGLIADGMKSATVVRLSKATKAALNLAARRDRRITNRNEWRDGLSGIAENYASRNLQRLDDDQVRAVVAAAYEVDHSFGAYIETAAITGARLSQIARLVVADLLFDPPRLNMPCSHKGRGRKPSKRAVPITAALADKLKSNRPADAPLLLRSDGQPWQSRQAGDHEELYRKAAERAGVGGTTVYALRHSAVIRALLKNIPVRVVAASVDSSVGQVERTYSAFITDFSDQLTRPALIDLSPSAPDSKVVPLGRK
jgi:integrase